MHKQKRGNLRLYSAVTASLWDRPHHSAVTAPWWVGVMTRDFDSCSLVPAPPLSLVPGFLVAGTRAPTGAAYPVELSGRDSAARAWRVHLVVTNQGNNSQGLSWGHGTGQGGVIF